MKSGTKKIRTTLKVAAFVTGAAFISNRVEKINLGFNRKR